jgi:hypothetical protein
MNMKIQTAICIHCQFPVAVPEFALAELKGGAQHVPNYGEESRKNSHPSLIIGTLPINHYLTNKRTLLIELECHIGAEPVLFTVYFHKINLLAFSLPSRCLPSRRFSARVSTKILISPAKPQVQLTLAWGSRNSSVGNVSKRRNGHDRILVRLLTGTIGFSLLCGIQTCSGT